MSNTQKRLDYLDGLRGIMSINVILCHFVCVFYPQMYKSSNDVGDILSYFGKTPLNVLVNGDIAVQYFFMLTGFLVSLSVIKNNYDGEIIRKKIANRYFRLLPIVSAATVFTYLMMKCGLQYHLDILDKLPQSTIVDGYCNFVPSFKSMVTTCLYWTYKEGNDFVGPFWTIKYELIGYVIVLLLCFILKNSKFRRIIYLASLWFVGGNYRAFILGALVADLCLSKDDTLFSKYYNKLITNKIFLSGCFIFGLFFACCPIKFSSIYSIFETISFRLVTPSTFRAIGISLITYVIVKSPFIHKFFENKIFMFLGKISFSTYAFHWPLMLTVQCGLFKLFIERISYNQAAVLSFLVVLPVIIGFSWLSWLLIEEKMKFDTSSFEKAIKKVNLKIHNKTNVAN
ncbi:MAG: acyltransferase family protein [Acutalibacteraceae bacterium]